ncbi:MAG: hypothetical protein KIH63_000795 [Candidatus Saccharibacteria bacterium]|nr:hypothetical protein [Candidatus Saccharibacteria bacterium]
MILVLLDFLAGLTAAGTDSVISGTGEDGFADESTDSELGSSAGGSLMAGTTAGSDSFDDVIVSLTASGTSGTDFGSGGLTSFMLGCVVLDAPFVSAVAFGSSMISLSLQFG